MSFYVDPLPINQYRDRDGRYQRPHTFKFTKRPHARIRATIYGRDAFTCQDCGYRPEQIPDGYDGHRNIGRLQLDHIIALRAGGPRFALDNLQTLCSACNGRKGGL